MPEKNLIGPSSAGSRAPFAALLGLGWALALACAHGPGGDAGAPRTLLPDAQALSHGAPTLWQRFEAEAGRPRLLILASPT